MNSQEQVIIEGDAGKTAIRVGTGDQPIGRSALIVGSKAGGSDKLTTKALQPIAEVAKWMNETESGAWVALQRGYRRVAVLQSNQSTFYKSRHRAESGYHARVWIDFYFRTLYAAFELVTEVSQTKNVVLHHPTANLEAWNESFTATTLDVISHLADRPQTRIEAVSFSCPHSLKLRDVRDIVTVAGIGERQATLDANDSLSYRAKQLQNRFPERSKLKNFNIEKVEPADVGCPTVTGVKLFKIEMPAQE